MGQPQRQDNPAQIAPTPVTSVPEPEVAPASNDTGTVSWQKPTGLGRTGWIVLAAVVLAFQVPLIARALRGEQPVTASIPFTDDFADGTALTRHYWTTGGHWRVINGQLFSPGVKNNPLWLQAKLPRDVAVEFDVRSDSPEGDIKVEIFGDGLNHASGYVLIHGGWNNRLSIIARLDEHGTPLPALQERAKKRGLSNAGLVETGVFRDDTRMRVEANPYPVQIGRSYRWRIERRGSMLRWFIDGQLFMEFDDPIPLEGEGHDRFGFSSWESNLTFDNLSIQPL
ncbi:MAG: hypothetical protein WBV82_31695 [Myxococcaceae bacterium]